MREGAIFWTTSESHYYAEPRRLAALGFLQARTEPGRTRPRTPYELTDAGREALTAWLAEPAAMPRVQNESMVKLLAADFSDDATIAASLAGVRAGIERAYRDLEEMERRALQIPHRTRYLRLIDDTPGARSTPRASGSTPFRRSSSGNSRSERTAGYGDAGGVGLRRLPRALRNAIGGMRSL